MALPKYNLEGQVFGRLKVTKKIIARVILEFVLRNKILIIKDI